MIAYVQGKIAEIEPAYAVVDCQGIGYFVKISLNTYGAIKEKTSVKLHTYFMVREDAQQLFGFSDPAEKQLFEQLISISGVGGNTALMILSSLSPQELYRAITQEDTAALKRVKGIGAKTAGRIVLELKDKLKIEGEMGAQPTKGKVADSAKKQEALTALTSLGLNKNVMNQRIDKILKDEGPDVSVEQIIKLALRNQ
ncbi:MAG: Holliday junction branch migration protein RuvA [Bacteroidota bacterium]